MWRRKLEVEEKIKQYISLRRSRGEKGESRVSDSPILRCGRSLGVLCVYGSCTHIPTSGPRLLISSLPAYFTLPIHVTSPLRLISVQTFIDHPLLFFSFPGREEDPISPLFSTSPSSLHTFFEALTLTVKLNRVRPTLLGLLGFLDQTGYHTTPSRAVCSFHADCTVECLPVSVRPCGDFGDRGVEDPRASMGFSFRVLPSQRPLALVTNRLDSK